MFKFILTKHHRAVRIVRNQRGFTLIEAVIGVALLSIVMLTVLMGIATAFKAAATTDKISTALALAQSQIEYIQTLPYIPADESGNANYPVYGTIPSNYSMTLSAVSIDNTTGEIPTPYISDTGLQKITVVVLQLNNPNVVTLMGYKVNPDKDT